MTQATSAPATPEPPSPLAELPTSSKLLLPPAIGLGLSSASITLIAQNAYQGMATALPEMGSLLLSCLASAMLIAASLRAGRFPKRVVSLVTFLSIHFTGIAALVLAIVGVTGTPVPPLTELLLKAAIVTGSAFLQFYWLRKLRGTSSAAVTLMALAALGGGELAAMACGFTPITRSFAAFVFAFAQFGAVRASRAMPVPSDAFPAISETYFGTHEQRFSNQAYLAAAACGICLVAIPVGIGVTFPAGSTMAHGIPTRLAIALIAAVLDAVGTRAILREPGRSIATTIWLILDVLIAGGAVLLATGGVVEVTGSIVMIVASLVLRGLVWYLSVAFISFGTRDPYFYTAIAWIAAHICQVVGMGITTALAWVAPHNPALAIALMGLLCVLATYVVLTQLLNDPAAARAAAPEAPTPVPEAPETETPSVDRAPITAPITQDDVRRIPLMGVMAVAPDTHTPLPSVMPDVHIATSVIQMGQQFGLSGREIEVLTLYALGHTQARVSEELQLSPNTVHTHIKRIYDKTNLHSRQEILDYIAEYGA